MICQVVLSVVFVILSSAHAYPILMDNGYLDDRHRHIRSIKTENSDVPDKEIFKIPRNLNVGDKIIVTGLMKDDHEVLTVSLMASNEEGKPDHLNVACQVRLDFPGITSSKDMITINTIVNGKRNEVDERVQATELFLDNKFEMKFTMLPDHEIALNIKESSTRKDCITGGLDAIQYLTVGGDVHKVEELHFVLG